MKDLMPVDEAARLVLDGIEPLPAEMVPLGDTLDRVLADPLAARRTQPPFDVSAMDGYAVRSVDLPSLRAELQVIGTAPAGHPFSGMVSAGEAVRIFTGSAMPLGADSVLLQEDAELVGEGRVRAKQSVAPSQHVRPRGLDFTAGQTMLQAGTRLGMRQMALAASMNYPELPVRRRPLVAIIATGDELVLPGPDAADDRIVASNTYGIAALVQRLGGRSLDLGIVPDDRKKLADAVDRAIASEADVLVTLGGASVGDHDFAQEVLTERGMTLGFWKIAMRPGKPLIFGRLRATRVLGLPGNPVSSLVCALLFLKPLLEALQGLPKADPTVAATLGGGMRANDRRQDYVRARLVEQDDGTRIATPLDRQDSSMLSTFAEAGCLIVRPPFAEAAETGAPCRIIKLP